MKNLSSNLQANEARSNFYQILEEAGTNLRQFIITPRGKKPSVVIMSADEYEGWLETIEILSDPKLSESIRKSLKTKKTYSKKEADKLIGW